MTYLRFRPSESHAPCWGTLTIWSRLVLVAPPPGQKKLFYFEHPHLGDLGIGHFRESLGLGAPGSLWTRESLGVDRARRRVEFKF